MTKATLLRGLIGIAPLVALIALPLLVVAGALGVGQAELWRHLWEFVLPEVWRNTLWQLFGVGLGVLLLGVPLAWLTTQCDFPGRRFFAWALLLPLAMPAYVLAFVLVGWLDYAGPLQTWLRERWAYGGSLPPIRSCGGMVLTLSLAFYPYVYLLAREAFLGQGQRLLEVAQSLGLSRRQAFWQVVLPTARPWLVGGVSLALMECLADFGAVSIFNLETFSTAIYKAWFSLFSLPAALQLAALLIVLVLGLIGLEAHSRGARRYQGKGARAERLTLQGPTRLLAPLFCATVFLLAFGIPLYQLLQWSLAVWAEDFDARYVEFVRHSLLLSLAVAAIVVVAAMWLVHWQRRVPHPLMRLLGRLATLGYAMPGSVLAVGVFVPIAWLDRWWSGDSAETVTVLGGTVLAMLLALTTRFLAVGNQPLEAAMQRVGRTQEEAARSLGARGWGVLWRVQLPQLRGGMLAAALLVFVETMKEMPITLMTRPFGWETLAIRVFEMTSEGMWERAALPSLCIVLAGLGPVLLLLRQSEK